jgi:peptidyl-tRNA hydrolase
MKETTIPNTECPKLYIIIRQDLYDNTPGKMMAQAGHAGSKFAHNCLTSKDKALKEQYALWEAGRGFGTKITLAATQNEMYEATTVFYNMGLASSLIVDDTYPFTNYFGEVFTAKELTCMYVFAPTDVPQEALDYLRLFPLHP